MHGALRYGSGLESSHPLSLLIRHCKKPKP